MIVPGRSRAENERARREAWAEVAADPREPAGTRSIAADLAAGRETGPGVARLDGDFHGSAEVHIAGGTGAGSASLTLTAGRIGRSEQEFFGQAKCHWLAGAVGCMTGWDVVGVKLDYPGRGWTVVHSAVVAPDGSVLDIYGRCPSVDAFAESYRRRTGRPVALRRMRPADMFDDYLTGDPGGLAGDPLWWTRTDSDPRAAGLYQHYARLVIARAGFEVPPHCRPAPSPATRPGTAMKQPAPGTSPGAATTSTGGTVLSSIDEIRGVLAASNAKAEAVLGAFAQASQEVQEIQGQLHQAAQGSAQAGAQEAMGLYAQVAESCGQLMGMVTAARTAVGAYAAGL